MNEYDIVVSNMSPQKTNEWYKKEFEYTDEEQPLYEVKEVNYNDGFWMETDIEELEKLKEGERVEIKKMYGGLYKFITYNDALKDAKDCDEPYVLCSSEV